MQIHYTNMSGWSPLKVCDVDTSTLSPAEGQMLEKLVVESKLLETTGEEPGELCDGDEHTIEITTESGTYFWQWYGIGMPEGPPELLELIKYLSKKTKPFLPPDNEGSM